MSREYPDSKILSVVCAGPKQYAILLEGKDGIKKSILKIRGITLNYGNKNVLSFEKFKDMTLNNNNNKSIFPQTRIGPDKCSNILSRHQQKFYRVVNNKGFIQDNVVYPFGYLM